MILKIVVVKCLKTNLINLTKRKDRLDKFGLKLFWEYFRVIDLGLLGPILSDLFRF